MDFDLDKIREIPLSEVIGKTLELRREGVELVACCPFHSEKTPSFKVNDRKGIFHCFGCHTGGDVIKWVMLTHNVDFKEACQILSEENGIAHVGTPYKRRRKKPEERPVPDLGEFTEATERQQERLCALRGYNPATVSEAVSRGFLRFSGDYWMVTDETGVNGHIRRLNGQPVFGTVKSKSIADSWAKWPLGISQVEKSTILMTEGEPDFIAGLEVCMNGLNADPVSVLGGAYIHKQALPFFHGKRVIIAQQHDRSGAKTAIRWGEQLTKSKLTIVLIPGVGNDLNDLLMSEYPMSGSEIAEYFNERI